MIIIQEEKKRNKILRIFLSVILVIILMLGSFLTGAALEQRSDTIKRLASQESVYLGKVLGKYGEIDKTKIAKDIDFKLFWEVWDILKKDYVNKDQLTDKKMFYGALQGLVASAGDPYTIFMDPKISQEFSDDLAGTFEGIGAELSMKKEIITVVAPLSDSPAQKAGLRAGDKIYAINGTSTAGMNLDEAVNMIRGKKGTTVTLTIFRNGQDKTIEITIERDIIVVKSVSTELRKDKIYVVKISNFNNDTDGLFQKAVIDILKNNPKGLIIDLRNNPGGYLDTAVDIASEWIDSGVIVSEKFSEQKKNDYNSRGTGRLKNFKTVVLVNEGSASASEILAGALMDKQKATIVGEKTFGKGSVQSLEDMSDGSSVKITIAEWLTPNGKNINKEGIKPEVEVKLSVDDYNNNKDPQMDKAIELLTK